MCLLTQTNSEWEISRVSLWWQLLLLRLTPWSYYHRPSLWMSVTVSEVFFASAVLLLLLSLLLKSLVHLTSITSWNFFRAACGSLVGASDKQWRPLSCWLPLWVALIVENCFAAQYCKFEVNLVFFNTYLAGKKKIDSSASPVCDEYCNDVQVSNGIPLAHFTFTALPFGILSVATFETWSCLS